MIKKIIIMTSVVVALVSLFAVNTFADYYSSNTTLYRGLQGREVTNLQWDLKEVGYFGDLSPTGYFGDATKQQVEKFQRDHGLWSDGVVGYNTSGAIRADQIIVTGKQYLGVPYVWGGTSPSGFDCSGFTQYAMGLNGISLPRTAELQYNKGTWVNRDQLLPGDLVFFTTYKPGPSHVGIYIGNGRFIQASSSYGVTISDLSNSYYAQRYIGAKRII